MPLDKVRVSTDRAEFKGSLTALEVSSLASDSDLKVLQTTGPTDSETWDLLNHGLFTARPDVELRVYSVECDLSFLRRMPNVRRFSADCLLRARGVEYLASLENLEKLSVGIYNLETFDFLAELPHRRLQELSLGATKSKKPSLRPLANFDQLRTVYLEGQQKDIEVLATLPKIEDLTLRSISVAGLDFVTGLKHLWSLDIKLGGVHDLSALRDMGQIKYLELWQVRDLADISVVSTLHGLQYLFLQSLSQVSRIPDLSKLKNLRRVYLENMKGLRDLTPLTKAPALEEFMHVSALGMDPAKYAAFLASSTLKRMSVGFGSARKNQALCDCAAKAGIAPYTNTPFSFR